MSKKVNLVKLCVGAGTIADLASRQELSLSNSGKLIHVTRMWPKRKKELLAGGSIYWVFRGLILARQEIIGFEEIIRQDKIRRCGLILNTVIYKTKPLNYLPKNKDFGTKVKIRIVLLSKKRKRA